MKLLVRLFKENKGSTKLIILAIVVAFLYSAVAAVIPYLAGLSIDCFNVDSSSNFALLVILLLLFAVAGGALKLISVRLNNKLSFEIGNNTRKECYLKLSHLPVKSIEATPKGDLQSMVVNDTEVMSDGILLFLNQFFSGITTILITFAILLYIDWKIALLLFVLSPISLFISFTISKLTSNSFKTQTQTRADLTKYISETVSCHKDVRSFDVKKSSVIGFEKINAVYKDISRKAVFYSSTGNPSSRFVNAIVYAIFIYFGITKVMDYSITIGAFSALLAYASQFMKPFNELSNVCTELSDSFASLKRIFKFLDIKEMPQNRDAIEIDCISKAPEIVFENVSFSYVPGKPVIEDVSFTIKSGSNLAIVGPTGCGKTTLINLLLRFYEPDSGRILINGTNIADISKDCLRKQIGVVFQDTWFNEESIRNNISYGKPDASDESVRNSAKLCQIDSFISKLPNDYDEKNIETNEVFSEGEKQLLSLARAMVCQRTSLILDEATSNIDILTESKIQTAIKNIMKHKTSIVIAHRLSTIKDCDSIAVLDKGKLVEFGSHAELIKQNGKYAQMYKCYNA